MMTENFDRLFGIISHKFGERANCSLYDLHKRAPQLWRELEEVATRHISSINDLDLELQRRRKVASEEAKEYWGRQDSQC